MSESNEKPSYTPPIDDNYNRENDPPQLLADKKSLRQYWLFFSGQLFSLFGSSVVQFAIIWWLTITASVNYPGKTATILGIASVAGFLPFVLTSLFAGVLVDRWNRKWVIGVADFAQALVTGVLLLAFYFDYASITIVLIILAVRAIAQGFHSPASSAIIILMVPRDKLTKVNSYNYLFNGVINLVGPVVGAILVEFVGVENIAQILWLDVITFVAAVIPLALIYIPDITREMRERTEKTSFRKEFGEGVTFITKTPGLLSLLLNFSVFNILSAPVFILLPLVVIDPALFNGTATTLGFIMVGLQAGFILGSFILTRRDLFDKNVNGVMFGLTTGHFGTLFLVVSALLGNMWLAMLAMLISGTTMPVSNIHSQNIWQQVVPPGLQGRVMAVRQTIAWLMIPIAQLLGGILADQVGILMVYVGGAVLGLMALVYSWYMSDFQKVESMLGLETESESPIIVAAGS